MSAEELPLHFYFCSKQFQTILQSYGLNSVLGIFGFARDYTRPMYVANELYMEHSSSRIP